MKAPQWKKPMMQRDHTDIFFNSCVFIVAISFVFIGFVSLGGQLYVYKDIASVHGDTNQVFMTRYVATQLKDDFTTSTNEYVYCLYGSTRNDVVTIDMIRPADMVSTSTVNALYHDCSGASYGTVHNHPNGVCKASNMDIYSFGDSDDRLMLVQCGAYEYVAYTSDTLDGSTDVVIIN